MPRRVFRMLRMNRPLQKAWMIATRHPRADTTQGSRDADGPCRVHDTDLRLPRCRPTHKIKWTSIRALVNRKCQGSVPRHRRVDIFTAESGKVLYRGNRSRSPQVLNRFVFSAMAATRVQTLCHYNKRQSRNTSLEPVSIIERNHYGVLLGVTVSTPPRR